MGKFFTTHHITTTRGVHEDVHYTVLLPQHFLRTTQKHPKSLHTTSFSLSQPFSHSLNHSLSFHRHKTHKNYTQSSLKKNISIKSKVIKASGPGEKKKINKLKGKLK